MSMNNTQDGSGVTLHNCVPDFTGRGVSGEAGGGAPNIMRVVGAGAYIEAGGQRLSLNRDTPITWTKGTDTDCILYLDATGTKPEFVALPASEQSEAGRLIPMWLYSKSKDGAFTVRSIESLQYA